MLTVDDENPVIDKIEALEKTDLELEEQVALQADALKKAEASKGSPEGSIREFQADLSRTITRPINEMMAATDLALDEPVSPRLKHLLETIRFSGRMALGIINNIPDFSGTEAGKTGIENRHDPKEPGMPDHTSTQKGMRKNHLPDHLPGLAIKDAMAAMLMEPELYKRIIFGFAENNQKLMDDLKNAFQDMDWGKVEFVAHTIKGGSISVGATELGEKALILEKAARSTTTDPETAPPDAYMLMALEDAFDQVMHSITSLGFLQETSIEIAEPLNVERSLIEPLFELMATALESAHPEQVKETFKELKQLMGAQAIIKKMEKDIQFYDYDIALERMVQLADAYNVHLGSGKKGSP